MKKGIVLSFCLLLCMGLHARQVDTFTLHGTIEGKSTGFIYLSYADKTGRPVQDSAAIENNTFTFTGAISEPVVAFLKGNAAARSMDDPNIVTIFMEPGSMQLQLVYGDFKNFKLKGSRMQEDQDALTLQKAAITAELQPLYVAYTTASREYATAKKANRPEAEVEALHKKTNDIRNLFDPFNRRIDKIDYAYFMQHPDSYLPAYMLLFKVSRLPLDSVMLFYNHMSPKVRASNFGKKIAEEIVKLKKGIPGAVAEVFSATDINGKTLSLEALKGNYVLLDFWASWCVPCREGNPHLKTLYAKYKGRGFEIVGVADDDTAHDAWRKAVAQDGIGIWRHVLRGLKKVGGTYDRSEDISEGYGIHTLPTKILIDKNGMIIGRYGGGGEDDAALDKKLTEIFGT